MNNKYLADTEIKELICEMGKRAYKKGYVVGTDGNISIKCGDNEIWATPTGVCKGDMTPEMLVKMDLKGNILEKGEINPSSEVKMHLRVYNENPAVKSVVHAHPVYATAYAVAGREMKEAVLGEGVIYLGGVPCAKYGTPGSEEVPESIAAFCNDYNAAFLGNHGSLTWGDNEWDGYYRLESLEQTCKINLLVKDVMKEVNPLTEKDVIELMKIRDKYDITRGGIPKIIV